MGNSYTVKLIDEIDALEAEVKRLKSDEYVNGIKADGIHEAIRVTRHEFKEGKKWFCSVDSLRGYADNL